MLKGSDWGIIVKGHLLPDGFFVLYAALYAGRSTLGEASHGFKRFRLEPFV
jgi:hypothetical protein